MSPQAYVIAVVYSLVLIITTGTTWKQQGFSLGLLLGFILSIAFISLFAYDTLCLTEGNCGVWSWIRTVIYVLIPVIAMLAWVVSLFQKNPNNNDSNTTMYQPLTTTPIMPTGPAVTISPETR